MEVLIQLKPAIPQPPSWLANLLLSAGPLSEDELCGRAPSLAELYYLLNIFKRENWVDYSIVVNGKPIARVEPLSGDFTFSKVKVEPDRSYVFSRFAFIRRVGSEFVVESPLIQATLIVHDTIQGISSTQPEWTELLLSLKLLHPAGETEPGNLATWEFHDALFHGHTRSLQGSRKIGGTCRFEGQLAPPGTDQPVMSSDFIALKGPGPIRHDLTFSAVMEQRQSVRERPSKPVALDLLAEFLYRTAKCRRYPSAGGIHELEFYVAINECDRLDRGLFHYRGEQHGLEKLPSSQEDLERLLANAAAAWGRDYAPQVLIILSARFGRIAWKYEKIAYRLILLDAGVALQTMYLVATAMELAPCALGFGDSELFARAAGLNAMVESSVAEFALSSMR